MNENMTCEEFNSRLTEFTTGGLNGEEAASMEVHLSSCAGCREILEFKRALAFDPGDLEEQVPEEIERGLIAAVISDVAATKESRQSRRSWTTRYMMPAMAAAIVIFVFLTGFMLGEIRGLHREAGKLREDVAVMETVLAGRTDSAEGLSGGRSILGALPGGFHSDPGEMTVGEAERFLKALPSNTPVLSEGEAERLISQSHRLRRLAGFMDERPWDEGLTSGELLLVIIELDIDPDTRIPDEWHGTY